LNILVDIGHPAHVHLLKNFIKIMQEKGNKVIVTVRNIPAAIHLLKIYGIEYIEFGSKSYTLIGKTFRQLKYDKLILNLVKKHDIEIGMGTSLTVAQVSRISKMKSFILDDDDSAVQPLFTKFVHPFSDYLISPDVLKFERKKKNHITYAGYHELAYLHPNRFNPDENVLKEAGLEKGEDYFVLRFNAFKAHHDFGIKGISNENKHKIVNILKERGKVFITTEKEIDPEFEEYKLAISPEKVHSLLYYAKMFIGDSQTMTSEAAVLGTPAFRCNSFAGRISYLNEEEYKYGLTFGFKPEEFEFMTRIIRQYLEVKNLKEIWKRKREKMLSEKIDVTSFFVDLISRYTDL
jgi:predicted glycosyltransferase